MKMVLNQVFRTLLHSRLKLGLQRYLTDDRFQGDILLLEPRESDAEFFNVNPIAFWKRQDAIHHGFESVRLTIEQNFETVSEVLGHYGLEMSRDVARRRADRIRTERGWTQPTKEPSPGPRGRTPLRLVRRETA